MIILMSNDQKYYLEASNEFDAARLDEALWSKALSLNKGNLDIMVKGKEEE